MKRSQKSQPVDGPTSYSLVQFLSDAKKLTASDRKHLHYVVWCLLRKYAREGGAKKVAKVEPRL